ncbi:MAG: damage-inducible protein DinB [Bacteroidetes bacterium]|nr:MAG: damage-inducible protein DinB [Bacteroidota bacterium]
MNKKSVMTQTQETPTVISPEALLEHWQGHRRLTRKMIEAFPEDKLFTHTIGGMRPFSGFILEFLGMAVPGLRGVVTGKWENAFDLPHHQKKEPPSTKKELLQQWDETTEEMNKLWAQIPPARFAETDKAFGQWDGTIYFFVFYWIDNEIHHRGQGYVYLRSLGIEPPAFWDRS